MYKSLALDDALLCCCQSMPGNVAKIMSYVFVIEFIKHILKKKNPLFLSMVSKYYWLSDSSL